MTARIGPWAVSPQSSIWPELHNFSTSADCGNWGGIAERKAMIDRDHDLTIKRQAELLGMRRGSVY